MQSAFSARVPHLGSGQIVAAVVSFDTLSHTRHDDAVVTVADKSNVPSILAGVPSEPGVVVNLQ